MDDAPPVKRMPTGEAEDLQAGLRKSQGSRPTGPAWPGGARGLVDIQIWVAITINDASGGNPNEWKRHRYEPL
jgi:hypothetical protein